MYGIHTLKGQSFQFNDKVYEIVGPSKTNKGSLFANYTSIGDFKV